MVRRPEVRDCIPAWRATRDPRIAVQKDSAGAAVAPPARPPASRPSCPVASIRCRAPTSRRPLDPRGSAPYHCSSNRGRTATTQRSSGSEPPENALAARARCSTPPRARRRRAPGGRARCGSRRTAESCGRAVARRSARRCRAGCRRRKRGVANLELGDLGRDAERMPRLQMPERLPVVQRDRRRMARRRPRQRHVRLDHDAQHRDELRRHAVLVHELRVDRPQDRRRDRRGRARRR